MRANELRNVVICFLLGALLQSCGGGGGSSTPAAPTSTNNTGATATGTTGGGTPPTSSTPTPTPTTTQPLAANELPLTVDKGISAGSINRAFIPVTVCEPGSTSACQTFDHVVVDTGSTGFRVSFGSINGKANLPNVKTQAGETLAECFPFVSGYMWGSVREADIYLGGLKTSKSRIHVVADNSGDMAHIPTECTNKGTVVSLSTPSTGAQAVIGIGLDAVDCGNFCSNISRNNVYFACSSANCRSTILTLQEQVVHPVSALPTDNNGTVMKLPSVPDGGSSLIKGTLTLGIGTRGNNQLGVAKIFTTTSTGEFTTTYKGTAYTSSYLDSGTPRFVLTDSSIPPCPSNSKFYCPTTPLTLSATVMDANGSNSTTLNFRIGNGEQAPATAAAFNLASPILVETTSTPKSFNSFVWGLPFFYGKSVFTAVAGAATPGGKGPYWAF